MPDIISAKCFACGHVVKVPAALGGKKARCPKCTNTITIPSQPDGTEDVIGDEMLPEVARDEEILQGEYEDSDGEPASPPAERIRPQTSARSRASSTSNPRMAGRATQNRRGGPSAPKSRKNNNALVIGIVIGAVALVALIAAAASGGSKTKGKGASTAPKQGAAPQGDPEDSGLEQQCRSYIAAVNSGSHSRIMQFYTYDPAGERAVKGVVTGLIEAQTRYDNVEFKSVSAATGTVTFAYSGGQSRTLSWKKVDSSWMIVER